MSDETSVVNEHVLGPLTSNRFGEKFLFNLNRHSFDKVSAYALFDAKFGSELFKENTLNIIVGSDSGLLQRYVKNNPMPKGARYIFIEPEPVLEALQEHGLLGELDERIACISPKDWDSAIQKFKITDYLYINAVRSFNAICAQDDFINEYAELSWNIVEVLSQLHWENNTAIGQEAFIDRQLKNVADNRLPAKLLQHAFQGRTVVILAGGPSLDNALPWVKSNRSSFVVFAVSRISRQLVAAGIEPDFVFSVDPQDISFDIGREMFHFGRRTVFVCSYHASSMLVSQWPGLMFYLGQRLPWDSELNVPNLGGAGPTVTNTALNAAYDFGFKRVILAGVDLCFTKDGFTHAKGSNEQLAGPKLNLSSLQVETNGGFLAPTGNDYAQAIKGLGWQARRLNEAGAQVINVSAGAAKIEGIVYVPLSELHLDKTVFDPHGVVVAKALGAKTSSDYLQELLPELKRAEFQVRAIARLAEQARNINNAMYNASGVVENYKDKKQLDRIEKKFKREHRRFAKLVKRFGIRQFIQVVKPFNDEEWTPEEAKQLGNVYYDAYQEGAKKLLSLIGDAIERVIARQQESLVEPDFEMLRKQWVKDSSLGRARVWRILHPASSVSPQALVVLNDCEKKFGDLLNLDFKSTQHWQRMKALSNLSVVRQRAALLFKHKKAEELQNLLASLDKHEQQDAVVPYRHLIDGYLAELAEMPAFALEAYHKIICAGDILLEDALLRVAGIGIKQDDIVNVNLALQCLSQLNPVFLPFYAEIQRLRGDMVNAIDAYNAYVRQFPSDILVQIKLANLYMEMNVFDAAEMMLDHILQQKPDLDAALCIKRQIEAGRRSSVPVSGVDA